MTYECKQALRHAYTLLHDGQIFECPLMGSPSLFRLRDWVHM